MEYFSGIAMEGDQIELPLGFRFHPSNEELINHYLSKKVLNINFSARAISEVDMNKVEPWESPFLCLHSSLASIAGLRHQPPPPAFVTDVVIDEKVDVIISEWMGYMLVYEINSIVLDLSINSPPIDCGVFDHTKVRASLSVGLRFPPSIFRRIPRFLQRS
ncbi:hypothetical protein LguiA_007231 [Lonicera macranthoides]